MNWFTYFQNTGLRHLQYCSSLFSKHCKLRSKSQHSRRMIKKYLPWKSVFYLYKSQYKVNVNRPLLTLLVLHLKVSNIVSNTFLHDPCFWSLFLLPLPCFSLCLMTQKRFLLLKIALFTSSKLKWKEKKVFFCIVFLLWALKKLKPPLPCFPLRH